MEKMYAICGLDCAQCEAYQATQAHDEAAKAQIAIKWQKEFQNPEIDVAYVTCDGCRAFEGHLGGHCLECEIRTCGVERGVVNCGHCDDLDSCEKMTAFLKFVPPLRAVLDDIRAAR